MTALFRIQCTDRQLCGWLFLGLEDAGHIIIAHRLKPIVVSFFLVLLS